MHVKRWEGFFRLFHGIPQHPQQTHGQRFGAAEVGPLAVKLI
jgi:hypothetical protein